MPSLETLERIADARSALVVVLLIGFVALAFACVKLYRDRLRAERMLEEFSERVMLLVERIYERYVDDLRGRPERDDEVPRKETQETPRRPGA